MPKKYWKKQQQSKVAPEPVVQPVVQAVSAQPLRKGVLRGYPNSVEVRPGVIELNSR